MLPEMIKSKREQLIDVCWKHRVQELSLFGSLACGDFNDQSDVDLLVEFDPEVEVGFLTLGCLQAELSLVLGRAVDLVPRRGLKPTIRQEVVQSRSCSMWLLCE